MKIILNKCYGGFGVSPFGIAKYLERKGLQAFWYIEDYENRAYKRVDGIQGHISSMGLIVFTVDHGQSVARSPLPSGYFSHYNIERTDPILISLIEEYGNEMNTSCSNLIVVDIPDDLQYEIDDYDGVETLHEIHRSW